MTKPEIVICCRDHRAKFILAEALREFPGVTFANSSLEALQLVEQNPDDVRVVMADLETPESTFTALMLSVHQLNQDINMVAMGDQRDSQELALRCLEAGAHNFIAIPVTPTVARAAVKRAVKEYGSPTPINQPIVISGNSALKTMAKPASPFAMGLTQEISKIAASQLAVCIEGESGTGKEMVALALHRASARAKGPFIVLNCAAIPESMIASVITGYMKGAFTDAPKDYPGIFEQAHGGTLVLDELGELPPHIQVKFLTILQERFVTRLGSTVPFHFDVWVIACTNKTVANEVAAGNVRLDFQRRVCATTLRLAPLRERLEDVGPTAQLMCQRMNPGKEIIERGAVALREEVRQDGYPANFGDLENRVAQLIALGVGREITEVTVAEIPFRPKAPLPPPQSLEEQVRNTEIRALREALLRNNGNKMAAARELGISRTALYNKLADLEMTRWLGDAGKKVVATRQRVPGPAPVETGEEDGEG